MKQLSFAKVGGWGGKRRGAGRTKKSTLVSHARREKISLQTPVLITVKLVPGIICLRSPELFVILRKAIAAAKQFDFYVIHFAVLNDHIHLFAEAQDNRALGLGMRSLCTRLAKAIRKEIGGRGAVFAGRYHVHVLRSPTEVRNALRYVLLNFSKHTNLINHIDDFSSGYAFREWRTLIGQRISSLMEEQLEGASPRVPELAEPQSWLAREGWKRAS